MYIKDGPGDGRLWQLLRKEAVNGLKETITISEGNERLRLHNKYGWNFLDYLYSPKKGSRTWYMGKLHWKIQNIAWECSKTNNKKITWGNVSMVH